MKEDKNVGEAMLKKRMQKKKEQNEREHGPIDSSLPNVMPRQLDEMGTYRQKKLDLCSDDILNSNNEEAYS